jgi:hypothetical protein
MANSPHPFFSEAPSFCVYFLKVKGAGENSARPQRFSLIFLSPTIPLFSRTQTGMTVSLKAYLKQDLINKH